MSKITITIDTPDTLETRDFAFEIDEALNMGFKHPYDMWVVEPKRGWWEDRKDPYGFFDTIPVCSECGHTTTMRKKYNYCPYCGVRMKAE